MKAKLLNLILVLTSLLGYLEWGDNQMFLAEIEADLLLKLFKDPLSVLHPFTLLPLIGQLLLVITLFQKTPNKILTYLGMVGIGILFLFMVFVGIISKNAWISISALPFLITAIFVIRYHKKSKS